MLIEFPFWRAVHILEICDNNGNVFNDKPVRPHGDWTLTLASLWQSELASGGKKGVFKDFQLTKDLCLKFSDSSKGSVGNISMKLICIEIILILLKKWSAFICFLFFTLVLHLHVHVGICFLCACFFRLREYHYTKYIARVLFLF